METDETNITKVKQNLYKIPKSKLAEINDFIEFILMKTEQNAMMLEILSKTGLLCFLEMLVLEILLKYNA